MFFKLFKEKQSLIFFVNKYKFEIIIICIIILVHELLNLNLKAMVQVIGYDESATLSWTGLFTDVSWHDIIEQHKYYGFGFSAIFSFLYYITDNPVYIYQTMQLVVAVLYAIMGLISYRIILEISGAITLKQKTVSMFFAIASTFIPVKFVYVINEHMYIFLNWVTVYLIVKLVKGKVNKTRYTIYLILVLCYSLTVHEKSLTLWVSVLFTLVLCSILWHRPVINYVITIIMGISGFSLIKKIISKIRNFIWSNKEVVQNTANATISTTIRKLSYLAKPLNWIFPIVTFISQLFFMSLCTGGIFQVSWLIGILLIIKNIRSKTVEIWEKQIFAIVVYTIICIGITILMQCISWMPDTADYSTDEVMQEIFGKRAKLYLRYFCCYCGPLIALFSVYIQRCFCTVKKVMIISFIIHCVVGIFIAIFVSPWYSQFQLESSPVYTMFIPFTLRQPDEYLTQGVFVSALVVGTLIMLGFIFLHRRKLIRLFSFFVAVFFIYQYLYTGFTVYSKSSEQIYNDNYPVYEILDSIKSQISDVVYMPELSKADIRLKFYLTDFSISNSMPDLSQANNVIIYENDGLVNVDLVQLDYNMIEAGAYEIYLSKDIVIER